MVRWRVCVALALLLLLPTIIGKRNDDDDDEERSDESEEEEDDDDDDDEEGGEDKSGAGGGEVVERPVGIVGGRRAPILMKNAHAAAEGERHTERSKKRPLECYVCAYKSETPLRACLDPTKFRVHTITCHSVDDRCFTSVMSRGHENYEAVVRGCRSGCVGSTETTCCETNRCNSQAFAMPVIQKRSFKAAPQEKAPAKLSKANRLWPPSVMFFVTILLILQTVGRVAYF